MSESELLHLRRQNELLQLDMEWDREERRRMGGPPRASGETARALAIFVGALTVLIGLALAGLGLWSSQSSPQDQKMAPLLLFSGLGLAVFGLGAGVYLWRSWTGYEKARKRYQRRRAAILGCIRPAGPQKTLRSARSKPKSGERPTRRRLRRR